MAIRGLELPKSAEAEGLARDARPVDGLGKLLRNIMTEAFTAQVMISNLSTYLSPHSHRL